MNDIMVMVYSYARALWRRRWLAIAVAWAVCALAWLAVLALPDRYEATARVYVDARTALRPVLEGIAIEEDYDSQLALVREALLSRPQLEAVARATNLDARRERRGRHGRPDHRAAAADLGDLRLSVSRRVGNRRRTRSTRSATSTPIAR
jgi:uncharacterized protein involved in exopolysaccharide biosynthesis